MSDDPELPDKVRADAAQWVAKLGARPLARETIEDFYAWRREPAHRRAFEEASAAWDMMGGLANRPVFQEMADAALRRSPPRRAWTISIGGWTSALAVAALLLVVIAGLTLRGLFRGTVDHYATAAGERREVALADGSRVVLGAGSRLAVRLSNGHRALELARGRAYFTVAHDASRPFTVAAGVVEVTATGTQFAVQRRGTDVDVTLVAGLVRVADPQGDHILNPGDRLEAEANRKDRVAHVDTGEVTAFRDGRLVLDGLTLAQAVARMNLHARHPIRLAVGPLADEKIGGSFREGDVDSFVAAATTALPLKAEPSADGSVLLTRMN